MRCMTPEHVAVKILIERGALTPRKSDDITAKRMKNAADEVYKIKEKMKIRELLEL